MKIELAQSETALAVVSTQEDRERAARILTAMTAVAKKVVEIGRDLAAMNEANAEAFIEQFPASARRLLRNCLRVGRGEMVPELVLKTDHAASMLAKLPIDQQKRWTSELIPVLVERDGKDDVLPMDVLDMGLDVRRQVFGPDGVRDIAAQKAWKLQEERRRRQREEDDSHRDVLTRPGRWTIKAGKCFLDPAKVETGLTRRDAMQIQRDLG
ncbi:hypothetical protein EBZ80_10570 [bacterium]|nr:hypothetical protein [bacterium]